MVTGEQLMAVVEVFHTAVGHVTVYHRVELLGYHGFQRVSLYLDRRNIRQQQGIIQ